MSLRALQIVSLAALLGLTAPLCLAACAEAAPKAHASAPPCHGDVPASPVEDAPDSHRCDCDSLRFVLGKIDTSESGVAFEVAAGVWTPLPMPGHGIRFGTPRSFGTEDLPPPDILLLKQTLLL
ncbi:MAG: hypothetical protein QNK05_14880 [Myxococcota bacterium]|nr:hypothetical protein [Myxococcota bacterium]